MSRQPYCLEVALGQRFRLAGGQEARVGGHDLTLRKIAFTRKESPPGFEENGDELRLTLEIRHAGESRQKALSWRESDGHEVVRVFWSLGDLEVQVEPSGMLRVVSVAREEPTTHPSMERSTPEPHRQEVAPSGQLASGQPLEPKAEDATGFARDRETPARGSVRRRRKRMRRSWLRRVTEVVLGRGGGSSRKDEERPSRSPRKHRRGRGRSKSRPEDERPLHTSKLRFEQKVGWLWSLRILDGESTIGVMRGANPVALVAIVEDHMVAYGSPRPGFSAVLRSGRSGRQLILDRELVRELRSERAESILSSLDSHYRRRTPHESHSMTVMSDEHGQIVNTDEMLNQAFELLCDE